MDVPIDYVLDEVAAAAGRQFVDLAVARATARAASEPNTDVPAPASNGEDEERVTANAWRDAAAERLARLDQPG